MNHSATDNKVIVNDLDEQQVADWLGQHPLFFTKHTDLLDQMQLPHPVRGAISLLEFQISRLRKQKADSDTKLHQLIGRAQENEQLLHNLHQLTISLLQSKSIAETIETTERSLQKAFALDWIKLQLIKDKTDLPTPSQTYQDSCFDHILKTRKPQCGLVDEKILQWLFPENTDEIRSAAIIPLATDQHPKGLLGLGSKDACRFRPDAGTVFLEQLGELLTTIICKHHAYDQ